MKNVLPYLSFDGNCREAMAFYKKCFGGELEEMTFGGSKEPFDVPPGYEDRIMHSALKVGTLMLMASDSMPGAPITVGDNVSVLVVCDSDDEVDEFYGTLKAGGHEIMPPADAFWGAEIRDVRGQVRDQLDAEPSRRSLAIMGASYVKSNRRSALPLRTASRCAAGSASARASMPCMSPIENG